MKMNIEDVLSRKNYVLSAAMRDSDLNTATVPLYQTRVRMVNGTVDNIPTGIYSFRTILSFATAGGLTMELFYGMKTANTTQDGLLIMGRLNKGEWVTIADSKRLE